MTQCGEALLDGVRARPRLPEPVRVRVGDRLRDRVKSEQVKCLHRSIFHRGDAERADTSARLRDQDAPERERPVAPPLHLNYCLRLLLRRVPDDLVHAGRPLAPVLRHPSHGQCFAGKRMGQQMLQGSHLAPPPRLSCLHDTRLKPTHALMHRAPADGVPVKVGVRSRTDRRIRRHLHCFFSWLCKLSRDGRPKGSLRAFAPGDVASRLNPYPPRYRAAFACSLLLYPHRRRRALRLFYPGGGDTGLPCSAEMTKAG